MADVAPRVSECTICPPWVAACAHFEGSTVIRSIYGTAGHIKGCELRGYRRRISVGSVRRYFPCPTNGCDVVVASGNSSDFTNLLSAQVEFRKREEEMLRPEQLASPPTP